jgi:ABC-type phosphate transport system substrate-binding protein
MSALAAAAAIALAARSGNSAPPSSLSVSSAPAGALPSAPPPSPTPLTETGSTLLYPLFQEWVSAYKSQFSQVTITTAGTGSGKGISSAAAGTAGIGASDAYLSPADVSKSPSLENIPLAIAAQEVGYNLPGFKGNIRLDGTVLAEMYQGTITTWNDPAIKALNPGVPGYELPTPSTISAASGFASTTPAAGTLSMINSSAAGAYPIINYEYAIVSTKQSSVSKAQAIKAFLYWAITKGNASAYLNQVRFQPLPSSVASISEALLSKIS